MADAGLRDLGSFVPGGRGANAARERVAPSISPEPSVIVTPPPRAEPARPVFAGDRPEGRDALGLDPLLAPLAQLAAHRGTRSPVCIGLLGGPGSGKSFALGRLKTLIGELAADAKDTANSPFLSRLHIESIDAAGLEGDPGLAIAAHLHNGLRRTYPGLARELGAVARDPHVVLREANEKLDETRRRLDNERRALDDASSRRARLTETVLYEAAGSQVDAFARANRAGIEGRLNGFGIGGDSIRAFKDQVQMVSGSGGGTGLALRALWAFKGQTKLVVLAVLLALLGVGLGIAIDNQSVWLGDLRSGPKAGTGLADWFQTHIGWLATARTASFALAALCLVANLFRAVTFLRPIFRGARLLESDLDERRRDLDGLYAHQTKRVDALERDVDRLARDVAEAERRAGGSDTRNPSEPSPFATGGGMAQAPTVFAALANLMGSGSMGTNPMGANPTGNGEGEAPQRIVLVIDHIAGLPVERARNLFGALQRNVGPGVVTLAAIDPDAIAVGVDDLERWIQVPVQLDRASAPAAHDELVRAALGHDGNETPLRPDARRSDLDAPVDDEEAALLASLTTLAGRTPRAVKRFANLYRLARLGEDRPLGILAFMLALAQGGTPAEQHVVAAALSADPAGPFALPQAEGRLRTAFDAAMAAGGRVTCAEAIAAALRAATFSIRPVGFI